MRLLWSKEIKEDNAWLPEYEGYFLKIKDKVVFFYDRTSGPCMLVQDQLYAETIYKETPECRLPLPTRWKLLYAEESSYLQFAEDTVLDLKTMEVISSPAVNIQAVHQRHQFSETDYINKSFHYGEYCISHKGEWGYSCHKDGRVMWEFKGYGWLYTDILFWKNRLFFGTAGQGGYFYVLDLETGNLLTKIKTGGTKSFVQAENLCYVLCNEKNARLICVDLQNGKVREKLELPGKSKESSIVKIIDSKIHTTTFEIKKDRLVSTFWNCVDV